MHTSILMSKPDSSLILPLLFAKYHWAPGMALVRSAKLGRNSLHQVGTSIPGQVSRAKHLHGAPPELMHPPRPLFAPSHDLGAQLGPTHSQESTGRTLSAALQPD